MVGARRTTRQYPCLACFTMLHHAAPRCAKLHHCAMLCCAHVVLCSCCASKAALCCIPQAAPCCCATQALSWAASGSPELLADLESLFSHAQQLGLRVGRVWAHANGPKVRPPFLDLFDDLVPGVSVTWWQGQVCRGALWLFLAPPLPPPLPAPTATHCPCRLYYAAALIISQPTAGPPPLQMHEAPWVTLQPAPGQYNETVLQALDVLLDLASRYGVLLTLRMAGGQRRGPLCLPELTLERSSSGQGKVGTPSLMRSHPPPHLTMPFPTSQP